MPPDVATLERTLQVVAGLGCLGWAVAWLEWLFIRHDQKVYDLGCSECSHCQAERVREAAEKRARELVQIENNLRSLGLSDEQIEEHKRKNGL